MKLLPDGWRGVRLPSPACAEDRLVPTARSRRSNGDRGAVQAAQTRWYLHGGDLTMRPATPERPSPTAGFRRETGR